ncbi:MAG: YifB family Mg chelatase-like AAA ATPase [Acidimicrobiia bacterium]
MSQHVTSGVLVGVEPIPVHIETTLGGGRGQFIIVGLPDAAVRESRERVRSAIKASGFPFPKGRVVVSLSPADLPKAGSSYDLPIAISLINAAKGIGARLGDFVAIGELSLHGAVLPTRGAIAAACVAEATSAVALVPVGSVVPRSLVASTATVATLADAVAAIRTPSALPGANMSPATTRHATDLADLRGQPTARRALEITAAGGHHMLMIGPPGAGKSMLAACLPSLLPPLSEAEEREVALIQAAHGGGTTSAAPPFRAPHHSISIPAMVGGGAGIPVPGEVTRAHRGVLFLDELGEFPPAVLDALRQPMEAGHLVVSRQAASVRFPSQIQVVAASNPCPCGYRDDRLEGCQCTDQQLGRYRARLSGPLLDRFDVRLTVERLRPAELRGPGGEPSAAVRERVLEARRCQHERGVLNRDLGAGDLESLEDPVTVPAFLVAEPSAAGLTARGWNRVRRVARTIADLEQAELTTDIHIKEAMDLREKVA